MVTTDMDKPDVDVRDTHVPTWPERWRTPKRRGALDYALGDYCELVCREAWPDESRLCGQASIDRRDASGWSDLRFVA